MVRGGMRSPADRLDDIRGARGSHGTEGALLRRRDGAYCPGEPSSAWRKAKRPQRRSHAEHWFQLWRLLGSGLNARRAQQDHAEHVVLDDVPLGDSQI